MNMSFIIILLLSLQINLCWYSTLIWNAEKKLTTFFSLLGAWLAFTQLSLLPLSSWQAEVKPVLIPHNTSIHLATTIKNTSLHLKSSFCFGFVFFQKESATQYVIITVANTADRKKTCTPSDTSAYLALHLFLFFPAILDCHIIFYVQTHS